MSLPGLRARNHRSRAEKILLLIREPPALGFVFSSEKNRRPKLMMGRKVAPHYGKSMIKPPPDALRGSQNQVGTLYRGFISHMQSGKQFIYYIFSIIYIYSYGFKTNVWTKAVLF